MKHNQVLFIVIINICMSLPLILRSFQRSSLVTPNYRYIRAYLTCDSIFTTNSKALSSKVLFGSFSRDLSNLLSRNRPNSYSRDRLTSITAMTTMALSTERAAVVRRNGDHLVHCPVETYSEQLNTKVEILRNLLQFCHTGSIDVIESEKTHFRMRANFNIWRDNPKDFISADNIFYAMFEEVDGKRVACELTNFPRGTALMNELMEKVMAEAKLVPCLRDSLFEVRFVTTQVLQAIVLLIYHKPLSKQWNEEAEKLTKKLNVKVVGRSRKQKVVVGAGSDSNDDSIEEVLHVNGRAIKYFQTEGAFSQPNAKVCEKMIEWAMAATSSSYFSSHDLLELYCGGGTFTAPLSYNFRRVLATEISKASVELAQRCFKANNITNISVARLSSEEFTSAFVDKVEFRRLTQSGIDMKTFDLQTVFVDPPRAGLDAATCKLLSTFANIIYISCNPETLARDLQSISQTHDVVRVAAFDQFPYTHHLESGVVLKRKESDESTDVKTPADSAAIEEARSSEQDAKRQRIE